MVEQKSKHRPSEKHTLDEVLKSLQDLIRNDIVSRGNGAAVASGSPHEPSASAPPTTNGESNGASNDGETDEFETALRSLDEFISNELEGVRERLDQLAPARNESRDTGDEGIFGSDVEELEAFALGDTDEADQSADPDEETTGEGEQPALTEPIPPVDPSEASELLNDDAPAFSAPPPTVDGFDDGIPVLNEVAEVSDVAPTPDAPTLPMEEPANPPPSDEARGIAIQVIAKLNIELRRSGTTALEPNTIDRLQSLLREALASKTEEEKK